MPRESEFVLRRFLDRFPEVSKAKFGRVYNFGMLEEEFEQVRTGGRLITPGDVMKIFHPARTPFGRYWARPNEKELNFRLKEPRVLVAPVPSDSRELVKVLLEVFHSLGHASLVLRFVHPEHFGIFSTPVVNLLQIHRANTVDLYAAFCDELRVWMDHFQLSSVAETEMALWTYDQLATGRGKLGEDVQARSLFEQDVWIEQRRVSQAVAPFLRKHGPLELSRILASEDPKLAGMIAGEAFERALREAVKKVSRGRRLKGEVAEMILQLAEWGVLDWNEKRRLSAVWSVRNKAVHPDAWPTKEEVNDMLDCIRDSEFLWDPAGGGSATHKRKR